MNEEQCKDNIYHWFESAQIDYSGMYLKLYVAFNAWYRQVTQTPYDRDAIARLKKRFVIWNDYYNGLAMHGLKPVFSSIVALTCSKPMRVSRGRWNGVVESVDDWRGLLEYWYQVRCDLVHGLIDMDSAEETKIIRYAYQSLNIFMSEIIKRMRNCFSVEDSQRLDELNLLIENQADMPDGIKKLYRHLQQKYINSRDIWNVDMS